jgi:hypothetical protein
MDNNQAPKRRQRSKAEPPTTPEFTPVNKYAPKAKIGKATLGRPTQYVETVGLGNLKVIHAKANDNTDVQSE